MLESGIGSTTFFFNGKRLRYSRHPYNFTWLHERRVEIPIVEDLLAEQAVGTRLLEVGNVLGHYWPTMSHPVVDRYERSPPTNLFNDDPEVFDLGAPFDLIVSISTREHIGWDEPVRDPGKVSRTVRLLRKLLSPRGRLVFTAPVGYSPPLDQVADEAHAERKEIRGLSFHRPYPFANGLVVAQVGPT